MSKPSVPASDDAAPVQTTVGLAPADITAIGKAVAEHLSVQIADGLLAAAEGRARSISIAGDDALLSEAEAAEILATRPGSLAHWRMTGHGPPLVKISPNRIAYRLGDLKDFIAASRRPKAPSVISVAAFDRRR